MQFAVDQFITGTSDIPLRKMLAKWNGMDWRTGELKMQRVTDENRDQWQTMPGSPQALKPDQLSVDITRRYGLRWPDERDGDISGIISECDIGETGFGDDATRLTVTDIGRTKPTTSVIDEPFQYTSLNPSKKQIRLMRVGPQTKGELGFDILLDVVDLAEDTVYHALSYVWGWPEKLVPISCH